MTLVQIQRNGHSKSPVLRRIEPEIVHIENPINADGLPYLSDGFSLHLEGGDWAALFPRHHFMWVSPDAKRVRAFIDQASLGYGTFLSERMKESFATHYIKPPEYGGKPNPIPKGQVLDSTICFLPTNDCNLGCKYCFSGAQPKKFGAISWEVAKSAIDLGVRNAVVNRMRMGEGRLVIRFFGGGEPTEYWDSFSGIVQYARASARRNNIGVLVATITNGQVDEERHEWFRENLDEISISMDGPPDIQNEQRPTFAGEDSFEKTWKFVSKMDALNANIKALRVTVTAQTVNRMEEIVNFFWDNLKKAYPVQFEPVYFSEVGRQNATMPLAGDFVREFSRVEAMARRRHDMGLRHAAVGTATKPLTIRASAYCDSLEGRGLFVTPDGYLSLCSEISVASDPRKDDYFVGKYESSTKRFEISEDGPSKIRCGPPWWCRGCFAQFSCRGGCEPRSQNPDKYVRKWWCQMVRGNIRGLWSDIRENKVAARARIGNPQGEELIWLPIWESSASMDD
jgi:radical SAM protein with 4Fe4S-binding SPASM domain